MSSLFQQAAQAQLTSSQHPQAEWKGGVSSKFQTNKRHSAAPIPDYNKPHPLFTPGDRKYFPAQRSNEHQWKPSVRVSPDKDAPRLEKPSGVKYLNPEFGLDNKARPERRHSNAGQQTSVTFEDTTVGKQTFIMHNRKTQKENEIHTRMGVKKRLSSISATRNGLALTSLGDKHYKSPDFEPNFFREGGLITGSTQVTKPRLTGNANANDFYSGLKLDGPLNSGMKTYVQKEQEQTIAAEQSDVKILRQWERNILREVDANYDPDDDSSDEEAIAMRAKRQIEIDEQNQLNAEEEANNAMQGGRKRK